MGVAVFGVTMMLRSDDSWRTQILFGVFLGLATLVAVFFGATLSQWYLSGIAP